MSDQDNQQQEQAQPNESEQSKALENEVPKEELLKQEQMKGRKTIEEYRQQVQSMEKQLEGFKVERMKEKEDKQALAEYWQKKAEEATAQKDELMESFYQTKKMDAIKHAALKANIKQEALDDLDYLDATNVIIEKTDLGRVNVLGAEDFVNDLKKRKNHWFNDSQAPKINSAIDRGTISQDQPPSPKELLKLQKENPAAYKEAMQKLYLKPKGV